MSVNLADYGIDLLSREQQLEVMQAIWSSLAKSKEPFPLSDSVKAELDRRIDDYERNPDNVLTLAEVKANLAKKFGA